MRLSRSLFTLIALRFTGGFIRLELHPGAFDAAVLDGGMNGWRQAGLPSHRDRSKPIELQRQVQIAAGSLVVLGVVLAALVSPWFTLVSAFVCSGLDFASVTGTCGMAHLLILMPWNKVEVASL